VVASGQLGARVTPFRFLIERSHSDLAQRSDGLTVDANGAGGELSARWLVHEWHEFVWKSGHRAADADAADVRAAANTAIQPRFGTFLAVAPRPAVIQRTSRPLGG
jgi:hypothetical protein